MYLIKEWVKWVLFRPKGSFRGWWNMTEEEVVARSYKAKYKAIKGIQQALVDSRLLMDGRFYKCLIEEIEKARQMSVKVQLKLRREKYLKGNK